MIRRFGFLAASSLLVAVTAFPAMAQTVPAQPDESEAQAVTSPEAAGNGKSSVLSEFPVEGGVHITPSQAASHDTDMIGELSVDSNGAKRNLAAVMKFVDAEGGIYGAEKACFPHRAALFQRCSFLILDQWKTVYGEDLPKMQIKDGSRTEDIIVQMWGRVSDRSEAISRDAQSKCGEVDAAMRQSRIWKYCSEPDWSSVSEDDAAISTGAAAQ